MFHHNKCPTNVSKTKNMLTIHSTYILLHCILQTCYKQETLIFKSHLCTREGFLRKNIVAVSFFQNCVLHPYS